MTHDDKIEALRWMKVYHTKRYTQKEVVRLIQVHHQLPLFSMNMLKNISRGAGFNWLKDNLELGVVTPDEVIDNIVRRKEGADENAGYRRMAHIIAANEKVRIKRSNIHGLLRVVDSEGTALCLKGRLKRRVYRVKGPNHIWASDGHDKLKPWGITIYGFIDAWSRRILSLRVGINNNDPRRIGVYFLETVAKEGGIPQKTSTDHGTETLDICRHQITFVRAFSGLDEAKARKRHIYTTSPHNQKIECLWSQLMKAKNISIRKSIKAAQDLGIYNPANQLQQ